MLCARRPETSRIPRMRRSQLRTDALAGEPSGLRIANRDSPDPRAARRGTRPRRLRRVQRVPNVPTPSARRMGTHNAPRRRVQRARLVSQRDNHMSVPVLRLADMWSAQPCGTCGEPSRTHITEDDVKPRWVHAACLPAWQRAPRHRGHRLQKYEAKQSQ